MIVGTAGHIDHGKTALVRCLTGVDTDRLPEEKRRGITIELGFAPLDLPGIGVVGLVDVPGHEAFVRTMVAGATGLDLGLLVVAADEGIMPQTREHLTILSLLDVRTGIVVLTKCDLAEPEWTELVKEEIRELVRGSSLESAPIVETSAKDGRGIAELKAEIATRLRQITLRDGDDLFRLPIDRAFSVKGTGTVVTGTTWSGRLTATSEAWLYPANRPVRVRGIQSHGRSLEVAPPGARVAVALVGADVRDIPHGSLLLVEKAWQPSTRFHAEVRLEPGASPLRPREWLRLHVGTSEVGARVVTLPGLAASPGSVVARVVTQTPLVLRAGDRFILRRSQPLSTVGGGRILDPAPAQRRGRPTSGWLEDPGLRLREVVRQSGVTGLELSAIPVRVGTNFTTSTSLTTSASGLVQVEGRIFLEELVRDVEEAVVDEILAYHDMNQIDDGMPPARLRAGLARYGVLVDAAISRLATIGRLEVVSGLVRRPGWSPQVAGAALAGKEWLEERLRTAGMEPPSVGELRAERGTDVLPLLRLLEKDGAVVAVESDRFYASAVLAEVIDKLARTMRGGEVFTPAQLREVLGVSRKFLVPLLEYCDRRRITERREGGRVLLDSRVR